ncbi:hypothetical protein ACFWIN_13925 [Streptomyces sp. NPDC127049]|uniref:hypothetical protein n=1 Tax=Streptomyces sp. NPDC127049 TaxID=3347118 RepID=UPI0036627B6C
MLNGCVTLVGLLLVAVLGLVIWLETQPERDEAHARKNLQGNAERLRDRLGEAAADGSLLGPEIARILPPSKPARGVISVTRHADEVTVIAELLGHGPTRSFTSVYQRSVTGCYAFEVAPSTSGDQQPVVRELPQEMCTTD